jgi:hypothetical protein
MEVDEMKTNYTLVTLALTILAMIPISSLLATSSDENCIDIDCLKERQMCREGVAPSYLDCDNILRCIDGGEQEIMKCVRGYPAA